jgi:hypothetical protein
MNRTPLSQGGLDGLCGLYSIVNALGLLFPSAMNTEASDNTFKVIAKAIGGWPDHLFYGTTEKDIREMLDAARKYFKHTFSWEQPFAHTKFKSFDEFAREIGWRIKGDDAFAVVGISKPWEHWTTAIVSQFEIKRR